MRRNLLAAGAAALALTLSTQPARAENLAGALVQDLYGGGTGTGVTSAGFSDIAFWDIAYALAPGQSQTFTFNYEIILMNNGGTAKREWTYSSLWPGLFTAPEATGYAQSAAQVEVLLPTNAPDVSFSLVWDAPHEVDLTTRGRSYTYGALWVTATDNGLADTAGSFAVGTAAFMDVVPEPSTIALMAIGLGFVATRRIRRG